MATNLTGAYVLSAAKTTFHISVQISWALPCLCRFRIVMIGLLVMLLWHYKRPSERTLTCLTSTGDQVSGAKTKGRM